MAPPPEGKLKARDVLTAISILVSFLTLIVVLFFSMKEADAGSKAQQQAKQATEVGLLTQLQGAIGRSIYDRGQFTKQFRQLRAGRREILGPEAYRSMAEEGAILDYVAWLFNNHYLMSGRGDQLWGPRMLCEYRLALAPGLRDPAHDLPDLLEFIQRRSHQLSRLNGRC